MPSLTPTSITVSLDPIELGAVEVWIADQPDPKPTREEAARYHAHTPAQGPKQNGGRDTRTAVF
jgi:hypothetical protein